MTKGKEKVFAVFGLGSFGRVVADVLSKNGGQVIVVDTNPDVISLYKNKVTAAFLLDSTDENAMAKAPFDDIDIAVVATGDSMETSIITTALLKKRAVPYILCRSLSTIHAQVLRQIGANEVINLQEDEGQRIASRLIAPEILATIPLASEYSIAEFYVPLSEINKNCESLKIEDKYHLKIVGIKRTSISVDKQGNPERNDIIIFDEKNTVLNDGDILVLMGKNSDLEFFRDSQS